MKKEEERPVEFFKEKDLFGMEKTELKGFNKIEEEDEKENLPAPVKIDLYQDYEYPSLQTRVMALFIDSLILVLVFVLASYIFSFFDNVPNWLRGFVLIFMIYIYDPLFTSFAGFTIGHYIMNLRVKNTNDPSKNIMFISAIFRFLIKPLLGWLSFLTVTSNKRKRAIHDILCGSVVYVNKK
jgi:uncharacterized RDD family membrane protein YckC